MTTSTKGHTLRDKAAVRWTVLIMIALTMLFAYMFVDVLSPLKTQLDQVLGWNSTVFGTYAGSEFFVNVFLLFLIFAGIILDKMGAVSYTHLDVYKRQVLGRAESFAAKNNVFDSALDGIGIGLGFTLALTIIGFVREVLGSGRAFDHVLFPEEYGALVFVLAPGAFIVLGFVIGIKNAIDRKRNKTA